ncbi:MAG: hypothetical protein HFH93_15220 [Lachnospiraceae bacterium]|nr:hypothetical protein [Lachnospiraceae bacterium]
MQQEKCILHPEQDCLGLMKARELERDIADLRKQNSGSHERIFERLGELEKQEGIQDVQYGNILEKLDELAGDVKELKAKPAKRLDGMIEKAILTMISAVVLFMLARMGIS